MVPAAEIEDEELPAESPQFFTSLSEVAPPSAIDEEREEEEDEEDEKEEEVDIEAENDKRKEDLEKIDSGLFENVRVSVNQAYQDIVEEYGDDGTLRRLLEDDAAAEFGYGGDDDLFEAYVEVDVLFVGDTPLGLYKGRVFPLEYTEDVREGINRMVANEDDESPADSFTLGVDVGRYVGEDDRRAMLESSIGKVNWAQAYVLRNATKRLLREIIRRSKFFDAFADKDVVKEIVKKRTGSGKMKGGKFFLSDLFDMLRGKRVVEH